MVLEEDACFLVGATRCSTLGACGPSPSELKGGPVGRRKEGSQCVPSRGPISINVSAASPRDPATGHRELRSTVCNLYTNLHEGLFFFFFFLFIFLPSRTDWA